jgi:uncharacterized membrane protein YeaQ/YmgE (transglycosylase-associated protein family)
MSLFLNAIGWRHMSGGDIALLIAMATAVYFVIAWVADLFMRRWSFGIILNALIMMAGSVLGIMALAWFGYPPTRHTYIHTLIVSGVAGVLLLIIAASFKRAQ